MVEVEEWRELFTGASLLSLLDVESGGQNALTGSRSAMSLLSLGGVL
jgi:hypothetical protein